MSAVLTRDQAELRIGSLFSGYGGLEQGVHQVLGGTVAWHSEIDPGACRILAHRYPGVPNLGDITAVDWAAVEPVDILVGGFPCQDVSAAGQRAGLRPDTRSGLWSQFAHAIAHLRPSLVVVENVRGLLNAEAHHPAHGDVEPCPWCVGDYTAAIRRWERALGRPAPAPTEPGGSGMARVRQFAHDHGVDGYTALEMLRTGRWGARLAPPFVEWMQGLHAGWVTAVPGLSRNEQIKALGNGVVPQQAAYAVALLLDRVGWDWRWAA